MTSSSAGRLILAATPMGQYGDASPRPRQALADADIVAAEDTRRAKALAAGLDVTIGGRLISYYDQVEAARTPALVERSPAAPTFWWSPTPGCRRSATLDSNWSRRAHRRDCR